MKLKNDWTWAYFLFNISRISYWIVLFAGVQSILLPIFTQQFVGESYVTEMPVVINYQDAEETFDQDYDFAKIHLNRALTTDLLIRTNDSTNTSFILYLYSIKVLQIIIGLLFFHFLTLMLKNVAENNPFNSRNPGYLYKIGWVLVGSGIAKAVIFFSPIPFEEKIVLPKGFEINAFLLYGDNLIILGIFSIVLGYVFKEAARIYEEQKLTV